MRDVQLVDADKYPSHCANGALQGRDDLPEGTKLWDKYRGTWITIGSPIPAEGWNCGVKVVYPVLGGKCFKDLVRTHDVIPCVCKHQIQVQRKKRGSTEEGR